MADLTFKLTGIDQLVAKLDKLALNVQKKGAKRAARKAMQIVRETARQGALSLDNEKTTEQIARNVAIYDSPRGGKREGGVVMRVGIRGGALSMSRKVEKNLDNPGGDTRYWRYLEHGAVTVDRHEFLLPALMNNVQPVTARLIEQLWLEVNKASG